MKNRIKSILILIALLEFGAGFSQTPRIDSLLKALKSEKYDTIKVNTLNALVLEFEFADPNKAREYVARSIKLAEGIGFKKGLGDANKYSGFLYEDLGDIEQALKSYNAAMQAYAAILMPDGKKGYMKGIASAYTNIGNAYYKGGQYPESLEAYYSALKIRQETKDKKATASVYNDIANVYYDLDNYQEALKCNLLALKIRVEIDDKVGISNSYNNLGNIYSRQGNDPEALKSHFLALKIREKMGDKDGISDSYGNIGTIFYSQKNSKEALRYFNSCLKMKEEIGDKKGVATCYSNIGNVKTDMRSYEEALENHYASLKIREELADKKGISDSYINIGSVYYALAMQEKDPALRNKNFEESLKNHQQSLRIKLETGEKAGIAASYGNIGITYSKQKKYKEAAEYIGIALKMSKEMGYMEYVKATYFALMELDSARGDYKGAYENHKQFVLARDSIDNLETRRKTIQSQMTYDFEKKEAVAVAEYKKELENQGLIANEKSRKQKIVLALVSVFLLLVVVFAAFIFRSLRTTKKQKDIIEEQKSLVELQKAEVEQQKAMVEEHQKSIIDSITYARRIQLSLLPTDKYIEKNITRLKKIK